MDGASALGRSGMLFHYRVCSLRGLSAVTMLPSAEVESNFYLRQSRKRVPQETQTLEIIVRNDDGIFRNHMREENDDVLPPHVKTPVAHWWPGIFWLYSVTCPDVSLLGLSCHCRCIYKSFTILDVQSFLTQYIYMSISSKWKSKTEKDFLWLCPHWYVGNVVKNTCGVPHRLCLSAAISFVFKGNHHHHQQQQLLLLLLLLGQQTKLFSWQASSLQGDCFFSVQSLDRETVSLWPQGTTHWE